MSALWLKNYPSNVNYDIDINNYRSMIDMFDHSVANYANNIAYSQDGSELTFSELDVYSKNFAAYLQNTLQIKKGDRIALMCPNLLSFPVAMWGIIRVGAIQVNVNPLYTPRELEHQLNDAQVDTIVIFSASTPVLAEIIANTQVKHIITVDPSALKNINSAPLPIDDRLENTLSFVHAIEQGEKLPLESPSLSTDDLLFLQYTGGTTGLSKGAMLSHGNILANILQVKEALKNHIDYGHETVLTAIPMYHIFALSVNTLCYFSFGAKNILVANPRDMPAFVDIWKNNTITFFTGVNTLFNGLLHTEGFAQANFSSLKMAIGGGAPVQKAVAKKWHEVTGIPLNEGYGLSETSPVLTLNISPLSESIDGIGIPVPLTDISIRDDEGNILPQGQAGELCAKGPQVMVGYWNNTAATQETTTDDGYFKTGDIAELDNRGYFHIVDRKKDMILVSGFNVYPNEIEAEVAHMPGILESACVGVEDETTGEAVKLFVVKKQADISEDDVITFCRKNLTAYKVPKQIIFIDEIPKSSVGKILRRKLR